MSQEKDRELLRELLAQHVDKLDEQTLEAFTEWQDSPERPITRKMSEWLHSVARRLGLEVEEAKNLFSSLSPERQAEMRKKAAGILPWERGDKR